MSPSKTTNKVAAWITIAGTVIGIGAVVSNFVSTYVFLPPRLSQDEKDIAELKADCKQYRDDVNQIKQILARMDERQKRAQLDIAKITSAFGLPRRGSMIEEPGEPQ